MIEKLKIEKIDKKSLLYLGVVLATAILACGGLFYYFSQTPEKEIEEETSQKSEKEKIIKQQLQELEGLREEDEPLTGEEIQKQLEELEALR